MAKKDFTYLTKSEKNFPHTQNGNVWKTESTYDYHRWNVDTVITVIQASWDAGYRNVVDFSDEKKRDAWFEARKNDDTTFVLTTQTTLLPSGTIRLPIPYDVLTRYNYLWVEMPKMPVPHEDDEDVSKYGFFIEDVTQIAPSTTELTVSLDYWTTFIDTADIQYMMLERGHAPMAAAPSVSEYLADPVNNSELLLSPDVDYGKPEQKRTKYAGGWYMYDDEQTFAVFATNGRTLDDSWGTNEHYEIPGVFSPSYGHMPGCDYLAIDIADLYDFIQEIRSTRSWFFESILGVYYIPAKLIETYNKFDFVGFDCYWVHPKRNIEKLADITQDSFGYADEYKDITKLYTYPYSHIEVTDNDGTTTEIRVENMTGSTLSIQDGITLAGNILTADAYIVGLSGDTHEVNQHFTDSVNTIVSSSGYTALKSWNIPQFAVYQDGISRANYKRPIPNAQARTNAETALHNAQDSANTANTNALASNKTGNDNAHRSAETAKTNGDASANTANANALDSNATANSNTLDSNATANANALASNATGYNNATASAATAYSNAVASNSTAYTNGVNATNTAHDNTHRTIEQNQDNQEESAKLNEAITKQNASLQVNNTNRTNQALELSTSISNDAAYDDMSDQLLSQNLQFINKIKDSVVSGTISGASNVAITGGSAFLAGASTYASSNPIGQGLGGLAPAIQTGLGAAASVISPAAVVGGAIANTAQTAIILTNDKELMDLEQQIAVTQGERHFKNGTDFTEKGAGDGGVVWRQAAHQARLNMSNAEASRDNAYDVAEKTRELSVNISNWNLTADNANNDASQQTQNDNTTRTRNTGDANAKRTRDTSNANASRTKETGDANANRSKATGDTNANRTKTTGDTNANRTRDTSLANNQRTYDTSIGNADATKATGDSNANRTRDTSLNNAQRSYDASILNNVDRATQLARQEACVIYGTDADASNITTRPIGVTASVVTESKNAIKAAGDQMLRYGYALGQVWQVTKWQVMNYYTYWKASDLWLTCGRVGIEDAGDAIEAILEKGVTVWSNPDEIGRVSIYDN